MVVVEMIAQTDVRGSIPTDERQPTHPSAARI
jgi:hypothetical protein